MRRLVSLLLISFWCLAALAETSEAQSYGQKLNDYLSAIQTLSANFTQSNFDSSLDAFDPASNSQGHLWLNKPKEFRVSVNGPSSVTSATSDPKLSQLLVSDGKSFWSYDYDLQQVVVSELNEDLSQVPVLLFSSDAAAIEEYYSITGYADEAGVHFVLEPISDVSLFSVLAMAFDSTGKPQSITITAATGQENKIAFDSMQLNESIPESMFSFEVPEGVDVIDDR